MAKVNSLFEISGTIGEVTFFVRNGKVFARKKTSLDKKRVKNDPAFARTMEAAKEFGGSSTIAKALIKPFAENFKKDSDGTAWNRLKAAIYQSLKNGPGERGKRELETKQLCQRLHDFSFDDDSLFPKIFKKEMLPYPFGMMGEWKLDIPVVLPSKDIKTVEGATHFRIKFGVLIFPPFGLHAVKNRYNPLKGFRDPVWANVDTAWLSLSEGAIQAQSLSITLPSQSGEGVLATLGIEFSQESDGEHYGLEKGKAFCFLGMK